MATAMRLTSGAIFLPQYEKCLHHGRRPVTFEEAMLCDSTFTKVDLSNVKIIDCNMEGMSIDGVLVTEMIAAYKKQKK